MFWDSSSLVPLLISESTSLALQSLMTRDRYPAMWWLSPVECVSALTRRLRAAEIDQSTFDEALARLAQLEAGGHVVIPAGDIRKYAVEVMMHIEVRAADAIQLAAARVWCGDNPQGQSFVCLDRRLREAAAREGFTVVP